MTAKREPTPPPARPPSLRQSVPLKQPPQLVNGKVETATPGRTRSAARHNRHSSPSSQIVTNSTPNTGGTTSKLDELLKRTEINFLFYKANYDCQVFEIIKAQKKIALIYVKRPKIKECHIITTYLCLSLFMSHTGERLNLKQTENKKTQ